ncbi:hypothetical protein D3C71_1878990 [compost metagenome]
MEPTAIEHCTTATISPPPASALLVNVRASQLHQPTGAAVASSPHTESSTAVGQRCEPRGTSVTAITAIRIGTATSVR